MLAPRPPYSLGQSMPVHPPLASFLNHATRRCHSPSSSSENVSSSDTACLGALISSHVRNSLRNRSSSGVKLKSMASLLQRARSVCAAADYTPLNLEHPRRDRKARQLFVKSKIRCSSVKKIVEREKSMNFASSCSRTRPAS